MECHRLQNLRFIIIFYFAIIGSISNTKREPTWLWECHQNRCSKVLAKEITNGTELNTCKLTCGQNSTLFPLPTGPFTIGKTVSYFFTKNIALTHIKCSGRHCNDNVIKYVTSSYNIFHENIKRLKNKNSDDFKEDKNDKVESKVVIYVYLESEEMKFTLETDESYSLAVSRNGNKIKVYIKANNFFGARHGLETLSQLIDYSPTYNCLQIVDAVTITNDKPSYKYRGLTLDVSRNFYSVDSLKRMIRALSYNKMNTLHLHLTDTHSFPVFIKTVPKMSEYGAYDETKVYTPRDIEDIVSYGILNGVRVLPEFDQPAHCGEGWQWGPSEKLGNLSVCFNAKPWESYCSEPPCGQLNPVNKNLYQILYQIYKELLSLFKTDLFHAGGDEINLNCWNSSQEIREWIIQNYGDLREENFFAMWSIFLQKTSENIYEANGGQKIPLILWTSDMTSPKYLTKYLDPEKYIIQLWTPSKSGDIAEIMNSGFKTIFSQYDKLYLDCGYGDWMREGVNWCSPYKDWKLFYESDPIQVLRSLGVNITQQIKDNVLGQEAAMWSETVDENTVDGKVWPRVSALAERLWTNPTSTWKSVVTRLSSQRDRMVKRGIQADALKPEWCSQNEGSCLYEESVLEEKITEEKDVLV